MYTMTAVPTSPYVGLFVFAGIFIFVVCFFAAGFEEWSFGEFFLKTTFWISAPLGLAWILTDPPTPPKNEPVIAELMDDSWHLREKSGKRYVENGYLMYMTPEGPVSFKRNPGQIYPQRATLYKN